MRHKKEKATPQISRESHRFHPSQISSRTALFTTKRRQIRLICQPVRPFVRTNDRTHRQNDFRKRQATALLTACSPSASLSFKEAPPHFPLHHITPYGKLSHALRKTISSIPLCFCINTVYFQKTYRQTSIIIHFGRHIPSGSAFLEKEAESIFRHKTAKRHHSEHYNNFLSIKTFFGKALSAGQIKQRTIN